MCGYPAITSDTSAADPTNDETDPCQPGDRSTDRKELLLSRVCSDMRACCRPSETRVAMQRQINYKTI